jgi:hypothetical protein
MAVEKVIRRMCDDECRKRIEEPFNEISGVVIWQTINKNLPILEER